MSNLTFTVEQVHTLIDYIRHSGHTEGEMSNLALLSQALRDTGLYADLTTQALDILITQNEREALGKPILPTYKGRELWSTAQADVIYKHQRRAGNTTRQVDAAIQWLFEGKAVLCVDNYMMGTNDDANRMLQKSIINRFGREHGHQHKLFVEVKNGKYILCIADIKDVLR